MLLGVTTVDVPVTTPTPSSMLIVVAPVAVQLSVTGVPTVTVALVPVKLTPVGAVAPSVGGTPDKVPPQAVIRSVMKNRFASNRRKERASRIGSILLFERREPEGQVAQSGTEVGN